MKAAGRVGGIGILAVGLVLALAAGTARATDFYVDLDWTGTEAGTQTQPFQTISNAVAAANAASGTHTLRIAAGTYRDIANGGLEDFSSSGFAGGGYALGANGAIVANVNVYGGYAGWDGSGTEAGDFDWSDASRVPRSTVVDLQNANARAFANNYGPTVSSGPRFDGLTFMNGNDTSGYGGGALIDWPPSAGNPYKMQLYINDCLFSNNVSTTGGGAVRMNGFAANSADRSWIRNSDFIGNRTTKAIVATGQQDGGGAVNYGEISVISNCIFVANASTNFAGAVAGRVNGGTILDSTFRDNVALGGGGAVYVYKDAMTIQRSTFEGNHAAQAGAAIGQNNYWGAHYTLINCLVADNTGGYAVAGGTHTGSGTYVVDMLHCTVANNSGGGVFGYDQNGNDNLMRIRNSIVTDNGAYGVYRHDASDPAAVLGHNDVYGNASADYYQCTADADSISADPRFLGAGDYHLAAGSPCRDAGASGLGLAVDLEGNSRPFNAKDAGFDMGCYEHEPPPAGTIVVIR